MADFTFEEIADWAATRQSQPERVDLAIIESSTGDYGGGAVLNDYDAAHNTANFRISLRGSRWYGRGIGTEATRLVVRHALDAVGLDAVTLVLWTQRRRQRLLSPPALRLRFDAMEPVPPS